MNDWEIFEVRKASDVPEVFEVELRQYGRRRADWTQIILESSYEPFLNTLMVERIIVTAETSEVPDGLDKLTGAVPLGTLRDVPYSELLAKALLQLNLDRDERLQEQQPPDFKALRGEWPKGDVEAVAEAVAWAYYEAIVQGTPTQQAVAEAFDVSRATAGRMISKARDLGHITVQGAVGRPRKKDDNNGKEIT